MAGKPLILIVILMFMLAACTVGEPAAVAEPVPATATPAADPVVIPTQKPEPTLQATGTSTPTAAPTSTSRPVDTAPQVNCLDQGGRIETFELESELLPKSMPFRVYLPPCYDEERNRSYPVLYLVHGQSYNDDQWDRLGADETADRLIRSGEIPPLLIVMPHDREHTTLPDTNRFAESVVNELVPWIDGRFRTIPERDHRAVGGLSRGGGWALHLTLNYWETFGAFGGHSMAIFWSDSSSIRKRLDVIPAGQMPRFYIDIGEGDRRNTVESNKWFETMLTERNVPHEWHLNQGYHQEVYWQEHVEEYLRWYTESW